MMYCSGLVLPPSASKGSRGLLILGKRQPKILCSARMPAWQELASAIHDRQPVSGLTHSFYKYPVRFYSAPDFNSERANLHHLRRLFDSSGS